MEKRDREGLKTEEKIEKRRGLRKQQLLFSVLKLWKITKGSFLMGNLDIIKPYPILELRSSFKPQRLFSSPMMGNTHSYDLLEI